MKRIGYVAIGVGLAAAATLGVAIVSTAPWDSDESAFPVQSSGIPSLIVHLPEGDRRVQPWTVCGFGFNGCADGDPTLLTDVPRFEGDEVPSVTLPVAFDDVRVALVQVEAACPRRLTAAFTQPTSAEVLVEPAGPAGLWRVDFSFTRDGGGDAHYSVEWLRPTGSPAADEVTSTINVLANHDGALDSYGVELFLDGLAVAQPEVGATMTVSNDDGASAEVPRLTAQRGCAEAGSVALTANPATSAVALGGSSFRYDVDLHLDGKRYQGVPRWSMDGDHDQDTDPMVWTPALPAYEFTP